MLTAYSILHKFCCYTLKQFFILVADAVKQVDLDMAAKVAADIVLRALDVEDCGSVPDSDRGMDYD